VQFATPVGHSPTSIIDSTQCWRDEQACPVRRPPPLRPYLSILPLPISSCEMNHTPTSEEQSNGLVLGVATSCSQLQTATPRRRYLFPAPDSLCCAARYHCPVSCQTLCSSGALEKAWQVSWVRLVVPIFPLLGKTMAYHISKDSVLTQTRTCLIT
jgi:hypothetical protein